ncbi:hypothetical protein RhiirA4_483176 [Rhizophagus irregularis]|uniref:Uncharacterized protein n=1 Tax=Rhizophagus irregularis TaxID=588596 RepID=A0A2I1GY19_9GLOM|nr:hypothetical protein RhiirA4_468616 [Rhizophagus irregularis]PKY59981.1 hypothetical protein RhiirA4_483176 [Rhizophagus irregularis]
MSQNQDHYKDLSKISEKTKNNSNVHVSETKLIHNRQRRRKRNTYSVFISFKYKWILKWKVLAPISTFRILVTGSYVTIRLYESGIDIYKSIHSLFLSLLPWAKSSIKNLTHSS